MDVLLKKISDGVGSSWTLLLKELELEPQTKNKIETEFSLCENKLKLCSIEALILWQRKPCIANLSEEEKVRKIVQIIHKIEPLKELAAEYGHDTFTSKQKASTTAPSITTNTGRVCIQEDGHSANISAVGGQSLAPYIPKTVSTKITKSKVVPSPRLTEDSCNEIIDVQDKYHKYALLDASQRILRSTWKLLWPKFNIQMEVIRNLETEKNVHERYYKLFIQYVKAHGEKATFTELRKILLECDERLAVAVIEERLQSRKGLLVSAIEYDFLQEEIFS